MNSIPPLSQPAGLEKSLGALSSQQGDTASGASFKEFLLRSIDEVNSMQQDADSAVKTLMTGGDVNPASVLTAIQKADMSFRMLQQIRNKLVQAYQEIKEIRI